MALLQPRQKRRVHIQLKKNGTGGELHTMKEQQLSYQPALFGDLLQQEVLEV